MYGLYNLALILAIPFLFPYLVLRRAKTGKGVTGGSKALGSFFPSKLPSFAKEKVVWVHAVSVGEVRAAIPLVTRLRQGHPEAKIAFSTVTATGQAIAARSIPFVDLLFYFPLDLSWVVRRCLEKINPCMFITLETEIWPHMLRQLKTRGVPALLVNGRISTRSFRRYRWLGRFFRQVLQNFSFFCMQTLEDGRRIIALGASPDKVKVLGNLKYDLATGEDFETARDQALTLLGLGPAEKIFLAGSTHPGEEEQVAAAFLELKRSFPDLILVVAPRHPERFSRVQDLLTGLGLKVIRRTAIEGEAPPCDAILLDSIGELPIVYAAATLVFIGGSLVPLGGHNPLEPAAFGKAVLFGSHMNNFKEVAQGLVGCGAAFGVNSIPELVEKAASLVNDLELSRRMGACAARFVLQNQGATSATMEVVNRFLGS